MPTQVTISLSLFIIINIVYLLIGLALGRFLAHHEEKIRLQQSKWKK